MATNHLTDVQKGKDLKLKIGCDNLEANTLTILNSGITFPPTSGVFGQYLQNDGFDGLEWINPPSSGGDVSKPVLPVQINEVATYNNIDGDELRGCGVKITPFGEMEMPLTGKIGIGEAPTANLSIKSNLLDPVEVKLNTNDINSISKLSLLNNDIENCSIESTNTNTQFIRNGQTRLSLTNLANNFYSPSTDVELELTDTNAKIKKGGVDRITVANSVTDISAPSGVAKLRLLDDRIEHTIRTKTLANAEVSGQFFVGQLIGGAQSNVYSTTNSRVGFCVDQPVGTTALNTVFAKNNILQASIDNDGKAFFPVVSTLDIDSSSANPLVIGNITATSVDIGKSASNTNIKGNLNVDEVATLKDGVTLGNVVTGYTLPNVRATTQGQVISSDASGNCFWVGSVLYSTDINCEITTTTPILSTSTYTNVLGFASTSSAGFTVTSGQAEATYTGVENITVSVYAGLSGTSENLAGTDNAVFQMAIFKNGVKQSGFSTTQFDSSITYPQEMSLSRTLSLTNGDVISMKVQNISNLRGLVVSNYTLTAHKIGY